MFIGLLKEIGIDIALFVAGICGGVLSLANQTGLSTWTALLHIFAGGICAAYLTPIEIYLLPDFVTVNPQLLHAMAFVNGLIGMKYLIPAIYKIGGYIRKNPLKFISIKFKKDK